MSPRMKMGTRTLALREMWEKRSYKAWSNISWSKLVCALMGWVGLRTVWNYEMKKLGPAQVVEKE